MAIPKLRAPIVLVHGLCGFDRLALASRTLVEYFPGIPNALRHVGNHVLIPCLSSTGGIATRAAQLKAFLDKHMPREPVHIIAHSMGGLDARYMISRLGMATRVLSLTTMGTPHRGSSFADWGVKRLGRLLRPLLDFLGIPTAGFYDLTTERCRQFNEEIRDAPGVRYFSVAGEFTAHPLRLEWALPHNIVTQMEGPNDGVVSVVSATYGECSDVWPCDHLSMVNWPSPFWPNLTMAAENERLFGKLLGRLREAGL